ncbi:basic phospholipase A2 homolog blK-PLA2-like isoform X4 [Balearica regulorum gibbericeps]
MAPSPSQKNPAGKMWVKQASDGGSKPYIKEALRGAGPYKQAAAFLRAVEKMNFLLAFAVLFALGLSPARGSLWDLHELITKVTGKNALLYYSFYGCYCGLGGKGQPKDATDKCCQLHDTCYDSLLRYHCNAMVQGYDYGWHGGSLSCKGSWWCARHSCECDRSLALCLKRSLGSYSKRYRFYFKHWCR